MMMKENQLNGHSSVEKLGNVKKHCLHVLRCISVCSRFDSNSFCFGASLFPPRLHQIIQISQ